MAYSFPHDENARKDPKIIRLIRIMGWEGYGLYWMLVEVMHEQKGALSMESIADIAYDSKVDETDLLKVLKDFQLFELNEGNFTAPRIDKNLGLRGGRSKGAKKAAKIRWEKERTSKDPENTDVSSERIAPAVQSQSKRNANNIREDNIREDNKGKKRSSSKKVLFRDSKYFEKKEFAAALPLWPKDKLAYYYNAALRWSDEGNKKINWIATVKNWADRNKQEGKLKFSDSKPGAADQRGYTDDQILNKDVKPEDYNWMMTEGLKIRTELLKKREQGL